MNTSHVFLPAVGSLLHLTHLLSFSAGNSKQALRCKTCKIAAHLWCTSELSQQPCHGKVQISFLFLCFIGRKSPCWYLVGEHGEYYAPCWKVSGFMWIFWIHILGLALKRIKAPPFRRLCQRQVSDRKGMVRRQRQRLQELHIKRVTAFDLQSSSLQDNVTEWVAHLQGQDKRCHSWKHLLCLIHCEITGVWTYSHMSTPPWEPCVQQ